tara:strand:+ start:5693 stop:6046 length:354 start_codon:yes stop_codon:yes gene_type:complete
MAKDTISYSWDCRTVDCYPTKDDNTDVVYNVHWRINATSSKLDKDDNPYSATIYGTQVLETDDITDFISFTDLDNAKVTEWVTNVMGEDKILSYKESLSNQIQDKITPKSVLLTVKE